jgi:hypothetical protein
VNLVAHENIDRRIVENLREVGHDVNYVAELTPGIGDESILVDARNNARLAGIPADTKVAIVLRAFVQHAGELSGAFSVLTRNGIRIRRTL